MEAFGYIVLIECAAVFLTWIGCRFASWRHRRAGWNLAFFGAVGVAALVMYWEDGSLLFHPSQWSANKRSLETEFFSFVFLTGIGAIPALFIVRRYRERFTKDAKTVV